MSKNKLTDKQQRFIDEYLIDSNATQACIRAGYSPKNADKIGSELLGKTRVAEAIAQKQAAVAKKLNITTERILEEYAKIAFSNIGDIVSWDGRYINIISADQLSSDKKAAIAEIGETKQGVKVKLHDKKGALDSLARHLGMFKDKLEVSGDAVKNITINMTPQEAAQAYLENLK